MRVILCSAALAATIAALGQASATSHGNQILFTVPYKTIGKWTITRQEGGGDSCFAETDNGQVSLGISHTDYTGDWYLGVPYYEDDNPSGNFGFGKQATDVVNFESWVLNGWAMWYVNDNVRADLKKESHVTIELDRGPQTWSLSGSSQVIDALIACAKGR
jgi:hypothetical protein